MKKLFILTVILLSVGLFAEEADSVEVIKDPEVQIYYFHTSKRCGGCATIEKLSNECISTHFAEELENGEIAYTSVNIDEAENKHFIPEYNIYTKQLILSGLDKNGEKKWKNLEKIWTYYRTPEEFDSYIIDETNAFRAELQK